MAYRSDFYNIANIIGYSGQLHNFPTVYFRCDTLQRIGRITQTHSHLQNIGRNAPSSTLGYSATNEMVNGHRVYVERHANGGVHTSRNAFIPLERGDNGGRINRLDMQTLAILAQVIRNVPYEKQMHGFTESQRAEIRSAHRGKATLFNELRWNSQVMGGLRPSEVRHNAGILDDLRAEPRILDKGYAANRTRGH